MAGLRTYKIKEELKQERVIQVLDGQQLTWFGHVIRMTDERLPKRVLEAVEVKMGGRAGGRDNCGQTVQRDLQATE